MVQKDEHPDLANSLLTTREAAALLKVDEKTIVRLILSGKLVAHNVGLGSFKPRYRIDKSALEEFLKDSLIVTKAIPAKASRNHLPTCLVDYFS